MQLIITDARMARSYSLNFSVAGVALVFAAFLLMGGATLLFVQSHLRKLDLGEHTYAMTSFLGVASKATQTLAAERAVMRQSMDEVARQVGEMQAKLVNLQALSERVSDLAGVESPAAPADATAQEPMDDLQGAGGPLVLDYSGSTPDIGAQMDWLQEQITAQEDFFTVVEVQLFNDFIEQRMIPTENPVPGRVVGSGFGRRVDPLNGRAARHTGLDFQAPTGTPILAAAGGIVVTKEYHRAYGNMVEIDHGNNIITRYAHASKLLVERGDMVRPGDKIAEVGSTGRSTGPHLHFEVLVNGEHRNPQRFLAAGKSANKAALLAKGE